MMSIIEGEAEIKVRQIYRKLFHVFMTRSHQKFFFLGRTPVVFDSRDQQLHMCYNTTQFIFFLSG